MRYAETGFNLEIDLATGNIERVETDPKLMEMHLGGLGTSVKIHWDRVPPETKPFDPENLLIFSSGLFNGTPAFSANRTVVTFISPQSELLAYPMMGGFWSAELKHAGYDKVIFSNKSPDWVYIWIHKRQGGDTRRPPPGGQGRPGDPGPDPRGTWRAPGPGGGHRAGRREPGLRGLHRAVPLQRQPSGRRRGDGRQEDQGRGRPGDQGHLPGRRRKVHGIHQRGDGLHKLPQREPHPRRDDHPLRHRISRGDGAYRRKVAHRELRLGQCPRTAQKLLDR